jgi:hypothetical protein
MITNLNIRGYINYLYLQRNGTSAPPELLDKWSKLPMQEIKIQLGNLYQSWQLSPEQSTRYENEFFNATQQSIQSGFSNGVTEKAQEPTLQKVVQDIPKPNYNPPPSTTNKSTSLTNILFILFGVGLLLAGYWYYKHFIQNNQNSVTQNTSEQNINAASEMQEPSSNQTIEVPEPSPATEENTNETEPATSENTPVIEQQNQVLDNNSSTIKNLLAAEEGDDFENVYQYFSPNMEQYWDISYPTRSELEGKYNTTYTKTSNRKNAISSISKVSDNTYIVIGVYSYHGNNTGNDYQTQFSMKYVFDDNGKIIYINKN